MYRTKIEYENMDGETVDEMLYFHMSEKDWVKADTSYKAMGGYDKFLEKSVKDSDPIAVMTALDDIIRRSYGIKSPEGKFVRDPEIQEEFIDSLAYDAFLRQLLYEPGVTDAFIKALAPNGGKMPENLPSAR